ncbi:MAG: metallophosphoesterase [Candidatus Symbiothrix sp.]|jgi:hypothetical protein|nr:metallophosphoesterase [Candidatus Symbiothrix sp.]
MGKSANLNKNDILIVPDIHGRKFWEAALEYPGEVIFLGDYTDPYPQEGFSQEDAYKGLLKIIDFKQQNLDRVTLLIGNHELHYFDKHFRASRFSSQYYEKYHSILTEELTKGLFQVCKQVDNYLFIHAGITKGWYDQYQSILQSLGNDLETRLNRLFIENKEAFFEVSHYRGGFHPYGSPLWTDINELYYEKEPFDREIIQIIGHTHIIDDNPLIEKNFVLVDNIQLYLLKNGKIEKTNREK